MRTKQRSIHRFTILVVIGLFCATAGYSADWSSVLSGLGVNKQTTLGSTKLGQGLKEALRVGIDKTVQLAGKQDGYFANQAIKILMPEKLKPVEGMLRKIGMGSKMDEFILSMNRAAESAAPYARDIFIDAITNMSIEDAEALMKGGDTAATAYFQKKTSARLAQVYKPIVTKTMSQYGVSNQYQAIIGKYQSIPFASKFPAPSIEDYTVQKSLDGLFLTLGEQEKQIRQNPAARTTDLLKTVFGQKG